MKKTERCCICGEPCSKKFQIEARKGKVYFFCSYHFQKYELTPLKDIREKIHENKLLLKSYKFKNETFK